MKKNWCLKVRQSFFLRWMNVLLLLLVIQTVQVTAATLNSGDEYSGNLFQNKNISGVVKDGSGSPIPGVSVVVKGTTTGGITDVDGKYVLNNIPENATLSFSFIGMKSQAVPVSGRAQINVIMEEETIGIGEVVAIGYGTQLKRDITGATSNLTPSVITSRPITRVDQALQGTTPGVSVSSSSGQPGTSLAVRIRGTNSITGSNQPLYVIDGQVGGNIESIPPEDIQSLEVLKDASATAIYGSRGSNGVILITTKGGSVGKLKVDFDTWFSVASLPRKLDLMDAFDFAKTVNLQYEANGQADAFSDAQLQTIQKNGAGTNWVDAITRTPLIQNYNLSFSGGTPNVKYLISGNYIDQPGILLNQWYKKGTMRANIDIKASDRLDLKFNLSGFQADSRNTDYAGDTYDPFALAYQWDPTSPIKDADGNYIKHSQYGSIHLNPVGIVMNMKSDNTTSNFAAIGTLNYKIIKGLTFTSLVSWEGQYQYTPRFFNSYTQEAEALPPFASVNNSRFWSFQNSDYFTYKLNLGDHAFTITALYERQEQKNVNVLATANDLSSTADTYYNLGLGATPIISSGYWRDALQSFMGRINYSYKNKYLFTASVRDDGSSHLTKKYSLFPSAAIGWNLSKEDFLKESTIVSDLKLRASYGKTGNQAVGAYATIPSISVSSTSYYYDGTTPSVTTPLGTPVTKSLKWETTDQLDAGIDASFLRGKLTFTADVYHKKIHNLLYNCPAPEYLGGGTYAKNMGTLSNSGVEFDFGGTPVSSKKLTWHTDFTISFNRNKLLDLDGLDNIQVNGVGGAQSGLAVLKVGQPIGSFWGYKFLGTWKSSEAAQAAEYGLKPGDAKYEDVNGDHAYNSSDLMVIGNGQPDFSYGFTNDINYGNFDLSFMFQGESGNQIYSMAFPYMYGGLGDALNATSPDAMNMWTPTHETDFPVVGSTSNVVNSSRYVYNASFVKLKNISLSYRLPKNVFNRINLRKAEVYVSGQNVFCITKYKGYDPETTTAQNAMTQGLETGSIPNPRTFTIGLRLGF